MRALQKAPGLGSGGLRQAFDDRNIRGDCSGLGRGLQFDDLF